MPTHTSVTSRLLRPYDSNGKVSPLVGRRPIVTPMLTSDCMPIQTPKAPAT